MKNKILINDLNKKNHQELLKKLDLYNSLKIEKINFELKILEIEKELKNIFDKENLKIVGLENLNLKITMTDYKKSIDYKKTIECLENKDDYIFTTIENIEKTNFKVDLIEKELKDELIYQNKKVSFRISVLNE